jgi:hypothetical protein
MPYGNPVLGDDFTIVRYSYGERDDTGKLTWFNDEPSHDEWERVRVVTLNLSPDGEPFYRNYHISKHRPLDPPGEDNPYQYDITDLAGNAMGDYDIDFGGGGGVPIEPPDEPQDDDEWYEGPEPPKRKRQVKKRGLITRIFRRLFGLR